MSHQNEGQVQLRVKRLRPDAVLPCRATLGSVGYDLFLPSTVQDVMLHGQRPEQFHLGISVAIPEGCYGRIAPRSGLAAQGVTVMAGVIDPDYTGEVIVLLAVMDSSLITLKKGKPIAQLILERVITPPVVEVEDLDATERGASGFGSTSK